MAKQLAGNDDGKERWTVDVPLYRAGIRREHVERFWMAQPFDLDLRPWEGNCDLCFLKGLNRKLRVIRDQPHLVDWWRERERERVGVANPHAARFRKDQPSYDEMVVMVESQPLLPGTDDAELFREDDSIDCFCG